MMYSTKIHLPHPLRARLKAITTREEISIGELIRRLLQEALEARALRGLEPLLENHDIDHESLQKAL